MEFIEAPFISWNFDWRNQYPKKVILCAENTGRGGGKARIMMIFTHTTTLKMCFLHTKFYDTGGTPADDEEEHISFFFMMTRICIPSFRLLGFALQKMAAGARSSPLAKLELVGGARASELLLLSCRFIRKKKRANEMPIYFILLFYRQLET